jgi:S-adenosylmethionine hydrolase
VDPEGRRLVGPDNGLFTPFLGAGSAAYLLADPGIVPRSPSPTFHGRDLFAPVGAWLAGGGEARRLGPRVEDPVRLAWPSARREAGGLAGECVAVDSFGNLVTSIRREDLAGALVLAVTAGASPARLVETFGQGAPGELVALWGSGGRLELAVREGSAARATGLGRGAPVRLRLGPP